MIASENYTSLSVMQAVGSVLTNKNMPKVIQSPVLCGCEHVDTVEQLAIDRAKELFGAQPPMSSRTRFASQYGVYIAALQPGDCVLVWIWPKEVISPMGCISTSAQTLIAS